MLTNAQTTSSRADTEYDYAKCSKRWLHSEAIANRIPSLKAGQRRIFNVDAVRRTLAARAAETNGETA